MSLPVPTLSAVIDGQITGRVRIRGARGALSRGRRPPPPTEAVPSLEEIAPSPTRLPDLAAPLTSRGSPARDRDAKQLGYVVFACSSFPDDLAALDAVVVRLRSAGIRRASRSWVIRQAIRALDVDALIADAKARR